jgi:hypothetical protein
VYRIVEFSFMKCNKYFVKRWELAQRNIREARVWRKAAAHFIKEGEKLAKQQIGEPYGPHKHIYSVRGLGGTSMGGERYGGRNYRVDLDIVECSCNVP